MAKVYEAYVKYGADVSALWQTTSGIRGKMVSSLRSAGTAAGKAFSRGLSVAAGAGLTAFAAGGAAAVLFAKQSIEAAIEQEKAEKKLAAVLRATGGAAGFTADQLAKYAGELQAATTFGDDQIIESMSVLATFRSVAGASFKGAVEAAMDMSEVMGTDLKGSVMQIAKALQDPVLGITALRRAGVTFTASQKATIKTLVDTGKLLEAQKIILAELSAEFGGAARAAVGSYAGAWKNLNNQLGEAKETLGFALLKHMREFGPLMQAGADGVAVFAEEMANAVSDQKLDSLKEANNLVAEMVALLLSAGDAWAMATNELAGYYIKFKSFGVGVGRKVGLHDTTDRDQVEEMRRKNVEGQLNPERTSLDRRIADIEKLNKRYGTDEANPQSDTAASRVKSLKQLRQERADLDDLTSKKRSGIEAEAAKKFPMPAAGTTSTAQELASYEKIKADIIQRGSDRLARVRGGLDKIQKNRGGGGATGLGPGGAATPAATPKLPKFDFDPIAAFHAVGDALKKSPVKVVLDRGGEVAGLSGGDLMGGLLGKLGEGIGRLGLAKAGGIDAAAGGVAGLFGGLDWADKDKKKESEFLGLDELNKKIQTGIGAKSPEQRRDDRQGKSIDEIAKVTRERVAAGIEATVVALKKLNVGFGE